MQVAAPTRRIASRCLSCRFASLSVRQKRSISHTTPRQADDGENRSNPVLEQYRRENPTTAAQQQQQMPTPGDIGASSIFEDERRVSRVKAADADDGKITVGGQKRDPRNMLRVLDPNPNARERYERKKVIQMVRRGARLTKAQFVKRTEREHLVKSHNMKTSVKKLGMLTRQIAGKPIEDAITQMRFSKKKVAIELLKQLQFARDEAVTMRGMGLGSVKPTDAEEDTLNDSSASVSGTTAPGVETKAKDGPIDIQLKNGKRYEVTDRSKIYIDQAWVGRGPYGLLPDYRARGRVFRMRTPWTSVSLLLKEETTRVREWQEREVKRRRQLLEKVWVPLPDRPIHSHRQWYSW